MARPKQVSWWTGITAWDVVLCAVFVVLTVLWWEYFIGVLCALWRRLMP